MAGPGSQTDRLLRGAQPLGTCLLVSSRRTGLQRLPSVRSLPARARKEDHLILLTGLYARDLERVRWKRPVSAPQGGVLSQEDGGPGMAWWLRAGVFWRGFLKSGSWCCLFAGM